MFARVALAVLLSFVVLNASAIPTPAADPEPEVFVSKEDKFKAKFPSKPKQTNKKAAGVDITMYAVGSKDGGYMIGIAGLPIPKEETKEMIQTRLDGARDGAVGNVGGKLQESKAITLDKKYPGREFTATIEKPKEGILRARIYLVGTRLYQVMLVGTKEFAMSKEADAFLDSFQITE